MKQILSRSLRWPDSSPSTPLLTFAAHYHLDSHFTSKLVITMWWEGWGGDSTFSFQLSILLFHITESDNKTVIARAAVIEDIFTQIWWCSNFGRVLIARLLWWIIFLEETLRHGLTKNSTLQYVYHFIFINFVEYWWKTHYQLYRRSHQVGIVGIDGWWEQSTNQQHIHHGGAVCYYIGMVMTNQPTPPPGASTKGVGVPGFYLIRLTGR